MTFFKLDEYLSNFLHARCVRSASPFSARPCMSPSTSLTGKARALAGKIGVARVFAVLRRRRKPFTGCAIRKGIEKLQGLSSTTGASQQEIAMRQLTIPVSALFVCLFGTAALADEGMWTFDNFPTAAVNQKYGLHIDQAWLDRVRGASVRLSTGCSASIVTADGLVLTNHHCVRDCAQQLSTADHRLCEGRVSGRQARRRKALPRHAGRCALPPSPTSPIA